MRLNWWADGGTIPPAALIVHTLSQAIAALQAAADAGRPATLLSAPSAATGVGGAYFHDMMRQARQAVPAAQVVAVLDCRGERGLALAALKAGAEAICVETALAARLKLTDIARQTGALVIDPRPPALDLGATDDPLAAARSLLAGVAVVCTPSLPGKVSHL